MPLFGTTLHESRGQLPNLPADRPRLSEEANAGAPNEANGGAPNEANAGAPNEANGGAPNEANGGAPNEANAGAPNEANAGAPNEANMALCGSGVVLRSLKQRRDPMQETRKGIE